MQSELRAKLHLFGCILQLLRHIPEEKERARNYEEQQKAEARWAAEGTKPELKELWNSQYAKGSGSDDAAIDHQPVFKCADIVDKRD